MKSRHAQILSGLFAFFFAPVVTAAPVPDISTTEIRILEQLAGYLDKERQPNQVLPGSAGNSCPVRSIRTALQFANSPSSHKQALFRQYSVNDYPARSKGVYNMVSGGEVLGVVKAIETKYPQLTDGRIHMAIAFCAFKDQNMWFDTNNGRISAARFFRSAFLASVFRGTSLDAVKITNEIDLETRRSGGY